MDHRHIYTYRSGRHCGAQPPGLARDEHME
jgi:hypothetical protein